MSVEPITKPARAKAANDTHTTLWEAFAAAQAEFGPIVKATQGQRGKYAPLDAVLDTVRPILNKHGLALTQATFVADGTLFVRSGVVHVSTGEHHDAEYPAGGFALQHQQLGAGVTYARRYSLLSLLGVFPENEDDDGEKAGAAGGAKVRNPDTGRMIDPNSSHQQRKAGTWERFIEKLRGFVDISELETWWQSPATQAAVDAMPGEWPELAHAEFEKHQEKLLQAGRP